MDNIYAFLGLDFVESLLRILSMILAAFIAARIINRSISLSFSKLKKKSALASYKGRLDTLRSMIINIVGLLVFVALVLVVASDLGFDIMPILTGVGIFGLALSLGSKALVNDFISGFFLILDNQLNIGDRVKIGSTEGQVKKFLMRNIVLEDKEGNIVYIPNSQIKEIVVYKKN